MFERASIKAYRWGYPALEMSSYQSDVSYQPIARPRATESGADVFPQGDELLSIS